MTLEFNPKVKSINIVKEDLTKITLEVSNDSLDGQYEDLKKLSNKTVHIIMMPETYNYVQQFDRSTKKPVQEWIIHPDGTTELKMTEQTQLDVDGQGNIDIKEITKKVEKEVIDDFILKSTSLEFPGDINPRDALSRMNDGEDVGEIADSYEMSDVVLLSELEKARQYFAPFADAWDKIRDEVVFKEEDSGSNQEPEEADSDESGNESMKSDIETDENKNTETETASENDEVDGTDEVDPY